ncbi:MAG TPA: NUDIX hydrolase [Candidatus Babeliales bacterium]|nr:NUDIX hydrolase [Candidatus Babeliales bacterium]
MTSTQMPRAPQQNFSPIVRVGVGVLIFHNGKLLLGKRKNAHGSGTWSPPGGHLEFGETPFECAQREVLEETGLVIKEITAGPYTNDFFELEQKHYITLFMIGNYEGGEPKVLEPHKCEMWDWFDINELPKPLFLPMVNLNFSLIKAY